MSEELESLSASRTFSITDGAIEELVLKATEERVLSSRAVIDSKYEVRGLIGRGGMGAVYSAYHLSLKREVALKTFRHGLMSNEAFLRFQREVKALAKVRSENVIQIFDFGVDADNIPYYTMELLNGCSLADRLKSQGALEIEETINVFIQVATALSKAHALGIIHRDIKPANIFLTPGDKHYHVKILDFGIAKILGSDSEAGDRTNTGLIFGSPLYMSPEQTRGVDVDHKTDIYSFGCTLFEALTGKPPYVGNNAFETMKLHQDGAIPTLKERSNRKFPSQLEELVSKALAKNQEERYGSFSEILDILPSSYRPEVAFGDEDAAQSKSSSSKLPMISCYAAVAILISFTCFYIVNTNVASTVAPRMSAPVKSPIDLMAESTKQLELNRLDSLNIAPQQKALFINDKKITKANLDYIGKHDEIQKLRLYRCEIDNSALSNLGNIQDLIELNLAHSNITDDGAIELSSCNRLAALRVDSTNLGDRGIAALVKLKSIRDLNLSHTKISAEGLSKVICSKSLLTIDVSLTNVTGSSIRTFCKNNPSVNKVFVYSCPSIGKDVVQKLQAEFPTRIEPRLRQRKSQEDREAIEELTNSALNFSEGKKSTDRDVKKAD